MATYAELKNRILRLLGDAEGDGYSDELILDAINAAQVAVLPWTPKTAKSTITPVANQFVYTLPTDLYVIEAVADTSTGEMLPQAVLAPGNHIGEKIGGTNDWIEYPTGSLAFSKVPASAYDLYYLATWTVLTESTDESFVLEPPAQSIVGMALYGAAYALQPSAIGTAEVRQFNTRIDSGNPEHNPLQESATYLLKMFVNEMNRHPKHQRAQR